MTYPQQGGYGPPPGGGYGPPPPPGGGYGPPPPPGSGYGPPPSPGGGYGYPPPGPGGYGQYPPPKKSNTGLIVGVAGVVVVAVVALVLVLVLAGDDDSSSQAGGGETAEDSGLPGGVPGPNGSGGDSEGSGSSDSGGGSGSGASTPEGLADLVVEVIETQDVDLIDQHACSSSDAAQLKTAMAQLEGLDATATVEDVQEAGDTAQAMVEVSVGGQSEGFTVEMEKDGDVWCVSGI